MIPSPNGGWMELENPILLSQKAPSETISPLIRTSTYPSQLVRPHKNLDEPSKYSSATSNKSYKKQTETSPCPNSDCGCSKCQILYNNPWKDLKIDEDIDNALQEFLELVISDYIQSWYVCQSEHDEHFIHEVKLAILYIVANVIRRFRTIKSVEIFIDNIGPICASHLDSYTRAKSDKSRNDETMIQTYMRNNKMHEALTSRQEEINWIKSIISECMPYLLPPRYLTCKLVRTLLRELFACGIILPALDLASTSESLYLMIDYLLTPSESPSYEIFLWPIPGFDWLKPYKSNSHTNVDQGGKVQLLRNFIKRNANQNELIRAVTIDYDNKLIKNSSNHDKSEPSNNPTFVNVEERLVKDLSAWSTTISRVECRLDRNTNREYFCFLINVHRLVEIPKEKVLLTNNEQTQLQQSDRSQQPTPSLPLQECTMIHKWQIERRYNEFYALESRLREFHGDLLDEIILPVRRTFIRKSHDFMRSRQMEFERFLQCLLAMPSLRRSELVRKFLSDPDVRFTESILPDINLSKIFKTIPSRLTQERGKNLDEFITDFIASTETSCDSDDIQYESEQNNQYELLKKNTLGLSTSSLMTQNSSDDEKQENQLSCEQPLKPYSSSCQYMCHHLYDCLLYLLLRIYRLNNWFTNILILTRFILRRPLQRYCKSLLLFRLTTPSQAATKNSADDPNFDKKPALLVINALRDALFPNNLKLRQQQQQQQPDDDDKMKVRDANGLDTVPKLSSTKSTYSYLSDGIKQQKIPIPDIYYQDDVDVDVTAIENGKLDFNSDHGDGCSIVHDCISDNDVSGQQQSTSPVIDVTESSGYLNNNQQHVANNCVCEGAEIIHAPNGGGGHDRDSGASCGSCISNDCKSSAIFGDINNQHPHHLEQYHCHKLGREREQSGKIHDQQIDQSSSSTNNKASNYDEIRSVIDGASELTEQYRLALQRLIDVLPNWLIQQFLGGKNNHEMACKLLLSSLEHSQLNKQIIFLLLNVYLRELFPELILK